MLNILNLLWIIPLSMTAGALIIVIIACVINSSNITRKSEELKKKN